MSPRPILVSLLALLLALSVGVSAPASAHPHPDVYERGTYDNPYEFVDDGCGFAIEIRGRARGSFVNYNVPGSDGQAFLASNRNRYREVLANPATGKRLVGSGSSTFREISARQVDGDIWEFVSVERILSTRLKDARGRTVLSERGTIVRRQLFDTLGDGQPGGIGLEEEILAIKGDLPSYEPDFDFCALVARYLT